MSALRAGQSVPDFSSDVDDITHIAESGWTVDESGALLLTAFALGNLGVIDPASLGLAEYDVNDVRIPIASTRSGAVDLTRKSGEGIAFAIHMLRLAGGLPAGDRLRVSISVPISRGDADFDLQGVVVRFFTDRGNYPDWFDDLERFQEEALAVIGPGVSNLP